MLLLFHVAIFLLFHVAIFLNVPTFPCCYFSMLLLSNVATFQCYYFSMLLLFNATTFECCYFSMLLLSNVATFQCYILLSNVATDVFRSLVQFSNVALMRMCTAKIQGRLYNKFVSSHVYVPNSNWVSVCVAIPLLLPFQRSIHFQSEFQQFLSFGGQQVVYTALTYFQ